MGFFKGNIILTDKDYVVLQLIRSHSFTETNKFIKGNSNEITLNFFIVGLLLGKDILLNSQRNFHWTNLIYQ